MRARPVVHVFERARGWPSHSSRARYRPRPVPLRLGGEERLEQLRLRAAGTPGAVVDHRQLDAIRRSRAARCARLPCSAPRVAHARCAAGSTSSGAGARGRTRSTASAPRLDDEALGAAPSRWRRTRRGTSCSQRLQADRLGATRSRRLSCSTSDTRRSRRCVLSWMMRVRRSRSSPRLLLVQQLRGVADGGERVADLVRDVGGEAAERGELELLRLLARARRVLDEQHAEALLACRLSSRRRRSRARQRWVGRARRRAAGASRASARRTRQQRSDVAPSSRSPREQALRLRVVLHHAAVAVDHQHAVVHVLRSRAG